MEVIDSSAPTSLDDWVPRSIGCIGDQASTGTQSSQNSRSQGPHVAKPLLVTCHLELIDSIGPLVPGRDWSFINLGLMVPWHQFTPIDWVVEVPDIPWSSNRLVPQGSLEPSC